MKEIGNMTGIFLGAVKCTVLKDVSAYLEGGKTVQIPTKEEVLRIYFKTDGVVHPERDVLFRIDIFVKDDFSNDVRETIGSIVFNSIIEDEIPDNDNLTYIGNNNKMTIYNINESINHSFYQIEIDENIACVFSEKGDCSDNPHSKAYLANLFNELDFIQKTGFVLDKYSKKLEEFINKFPDMYFKECLLDAKVHGTVSVGSRTIYFITTSDDQKYKIEYNEFLRVATINKLTDFVDYLNFDTNLQNASFSIKPAITYVDHKKTIIYVICLNKKPMHFAKNCIED